MKTDAALAALSALAHETRLAVYRILIEAGPQGLAVGDIADRLALAPATLSFHLAHLRRAGLVRSQRDGRTLHQRADYAAMNALVGYLTENCCGGTDACSLPARGRSGPLHKRLRSEETARPLRRARSR